MGKNFKHIHSKRENLQKKQGKIQFQGKNHFQFRIQKYTHVYIYLAIQCWLHIKSPFKKQQILVHHHRRGRRTQFQRSEHL